MNYRKYNAALMKRAGFVKNGNSLPNYTGWTRGEIILYTPNFKKMSIRQLTNDIVSQIMYRTTVHLKQQLVVPQVKELLG